MKTALTFKQTTALITGLIFVLLASSVTVFAAPPSKTPPSRSTCKLLLAPIEYEIFLGDSSEMDEVQATFSESGDHAGFIGYKYNPNDQSIYIDIMIVEEEAKGRGTGSRLFTEAISQHPEAVLIDATLAMDNFDAFMIALGTTKSVESALIQTPFYKMAARNGFTKIILRDTVNPKNYHQRKDINVTFARPEAFP